MNSWDHSPNGQCYRFMLHIEGEKMEPLKFSVITVCLNTEKVIANTIESVLEQTLSPYEYLIIDGLSTDRTLAIAESFSHQFEAKGIRYNIGSEKDSGIYNAMNKGIKTATGDFISFLNAGDSYLPESLDKINRFYQEEAFDLTYGGLNYINPDGSRIVKMSKPDHIYVTSRHWNHPSMFLRRVIYQKYGFDERFRSYADFDLYLKLRRNGVKIRVIPEVITNFEANGISTDIRIEKVLKRAGEKYRAYRNNDYSRLYWLESYGWELFKSVYFRIKS